jgi:tetratricopeptide (TPR) repeat protein
MPAYPWRFAVVGGFICLITRSAVAQNNQAFASMLKTDERLPRQIIADRAAVALKQIAGLSEYLAGVDALEQGKWDDAKSHLDSALASSPNSGVYHETRGILMVITGDLAAARQELQHVVGQSVLNPVPTRANGTNTRNGRAPANQSASLAMMWATALKIRNAPAAGQDASVYGSRSDGTFQFNADDPYQKLLEDWARSSAGADDDVSRQLARESAWRMRLIPDALPVDAESAAKLLDSGHAADALPLLRAMWPAYHNDDAYLAIKAAAELATGDPVAARAQYDIVLMHRPDLVDAYLGRGLAAAKVGCPARLKADLAIAQSLDPARAKAFSDQHAGEIAQAQAQAVDADPGQLAEQFIQSAISGADQPALIAQAVKIHKALNFRGRVAEEIYQDGLRARLAVVADNFNDAAGWADLATYLYSESSRKFGAVQRNEADIQCDWLLAMRYADQALRDDPHNIVAIADKAWLLEQDRQETDSLDLAKQGLALMPGYPRLAELQATLLEVSAIRAGNQAGIERAPKSWTVVSPDWITTYTRGPNAQELAAARQFDAMSAANVSQGNRGLYEAWRSYSDSISEMNVAARYYYWIGNDDQAIALWNRVLSIDPNEEAALQSLAEYNEDKHQDDQAAEFHFRRDNLFENSAKALTEQATRQLVAQDLDGASATLKRALAANPTDALVYALLARIAIARNGPSGYWPYAHCGEALEEAAANLHGTSLLSGSDPLAPDVAAGMKGILNGEIKVAQHDQLTDLAERARQLLAQINHRVIARNSRQGPLANAATLNGCLISHLHILTADNEMETAARLLVQPDSDTGPGHSESYGPVVDAEYPVYVYLRGRRYHFQLWHYFGPGTLETFESYFDRNGANIDPNQRPSNVNHPNAAE